MEKLRNGQNQNMSGKGYAGLPGAKVSADHFQSANVSDNFDKKTLPLGAHLSGAAQNQLLLTPASLQLAQLQAQLTLQRLKLAHSAVGGNTAATAASVLNQVLSNVAMSQPLFNTLRGTATMVRITGRSRWGFPTNPMAFPPPNSALGTLVGGGFPQKPGGMRLNHSTPNPSQAPGLQDYGKKGPTFPSDTDHQPQYGFLGGASVVTSKGNEGQYNTQAKSNQGGYQQRDFFAPDSQGEVSGFGGGVGGSGPSGQTHEAYPGSTQKESWKHPGCFSHGGKMDVPPGGVGSGGGGGTSWVPGGQQFRPRVELYNPEEPTTDPKFSPVGGPGFGTGGAQGFVGYPQQLQTGEDMGRLVGSPTPLQPHQFNDFHAVTPTQLPHQCTICDKKVYNLKDWDQHVKGKLHLQNRTLYTEGSAAGATHYPTTSEGCLNAALANTMAYSSAASQDVSSGPIASYLPTAAMKSFPLSGVGLTAHQHGAKFPQRKPFPGRVVHICNLPEGSCTENDVINLGLPFGKVTNYILMRSTHQAFLEMAYVEAAQAMVQYYQLQPATINNQKLLIRMSKRYKELQLKKPGKDVDSIIHDIHSQRERDEMQELDRYLPERPRSRSPHRGSLSPRSHSPSFTSCSSTHSPQGGPCRPEWNNGMGPRRPSWDWTPHPRREDDRERDEGLWRNGEDDRPNGRVPDRRKSYLKAGDRISPRTMDERGGRDWYCRGSPQGPTFPSYRDMDDFYKKEHLYKSDKPSRPPYPRHEMKAKRREASDYHRPSRHSESDMSEEPIPPRSPEDKKQGSPGRGRSKKQTRRQTAEKVEKDPNNNGQHQREESSSKERSVSPHSVKKNTDVTEADQNKESGPEEWESEDDTEGECWYPKNMEELVTVDEVGEEEDSIIEPDIPELQEESLKDETSPAGQTEVKPDANPMTSSDVGVPQKKDSHHGSPPRENSEGPQRPILLRRPKRTKIHEPAQGSDLNHFPTEEFKAALEETCSVSDMSGADAPVLVPDCLSNHHGDCDGDKPTETNRENDMEKSGHVTENEHKETLIKEDSQCQKKDLIHGHSPLRIDAVAPSPSREQDKVINEHSIPLGVEFIVPRTAFYCKLCGLFYSNEVVAKTTHCRSTVHYRNLQKYLSQLAEGSLFIGQMDPCGSE
ncbi:LOW QUALITY PROTEIN: RNA-binding protein 20 [Alosa alosa]|uniref:LOW QUALITY PROTEIN: RNA-binding protein 20 n=1 Tax=Alosa alosa TaxID=278164 RepID=UPI002015543D|nr:LOW QUALITY PROTEIN: RNA-binding protein 20 [Alosa alosa]